MKSENKLWDGKILEVKGKEVGHLVWRKRILHLYSIRLKWMEDEQGHLNTTPSLRDPSRGNTEEGERNSAEVVLLGHFTETDWKENKIDRWKQSKPEKEKEPED